MPRRMFARCSWCVTRDTDSSRPSPPISALTPRISQSTPACVSHRPTAMTALPAPASTRGAWDLRQDMVWTGAQSTHLHYSIRIPTPK
ncbi:hypothetical protein L227DRAFT_395260 [Lentinus tigrinus ALCF2SS1-6]|uniref:Uncharacterized protein n=1 Tax=Lentinus tigrinus ALCF2SS1-6 TaxID=1328759 RepID=A0A5C2RQV5_9APHY|nr:hypothetical protein L227DRAFT_395260 [Lentinus tigrinus ALCF2SS1-6]